MTLTDLVGVSVLAVIVATVADGAAMQPRVRRPALTALERTLVNRQLVSGERDLAVVQIRITRDVIEASDVAVGCVWE